MLDFLQQLNPEQLRAVQTTEGPLLIVAGAGTGKTKTLTSRVAFLMSQGVPAHSILAVTFTNKAAAEMLERVQHMMGDTVGLPVMKTFHSLGVHILRQWGERIGLKKSFSILDTDDQVTIMRAVMERQSISTKDWDPREIVRRMSALRLQSGGNIETLESRSAVDDMVRSVWRGFVSQKKRDGSVDFDDLIELSTELLRSHADIQDYYHRLWQYIHIDEYQDTSDLQYEFIRLLLGPHNNICVVGDGDQTIYTWRGATMRNILQFESDFPGADSVTLVKNYRSTQTILDAANVLIAKNKNRIPKDLQTDSGQGQKIVEYQAYDENDEAQWVADRIVYLQETADLSLSSVVIVYRSHYQSRAIEEALMSRSLPYSISGTKFFDRKEIRDVVSYARCALITQSLPDLKRVCEYPKRGIGKVAFLHICGGDIDKLSGKAAESFRSIQALFSRIAHYAENHEPSETMRYVIEQSGIKNELVHDNTAESRERIANIEELVTYATRFDRAAQTHAESLQIMFDSIALLSETDSARRTGESDERIHMLTIHSAKGLEWPAVFIVGLESGVFPSEMGSGSDRDNEEERRLMYVAVTRAREYLHISHCMTRRIYGQQKMQLPSQFVTDIPSELLEQQGDDRKKQNRSIYSDNDDWQDIMSLLDC